MSKDFKMKGIESKNGIVKLFNERVIFFPPNIISLLGSVFGKGSKPLLVYLGKKMGRKLAENWDEHLKPKNLNELAENFISMSNSAGWGTFSIVEISDTEMIISLDHNVAKFEDAPTHFICDFIVGYLAGFGEYVMYNAVGSEDHCSVEDSSEAKCLFKIKKRELKL